MTLNDFQSFNAQLAMEVSDARITTLEQYADPIIVQSDKQPRQIDWETAWIAAGFTLPIATQAQLIWRDTNKMRGQYATINDRFYNLIPSDVQNSEIKVMGWEDDYHLIGKWLRVSGVGSSNDYVRIYMDGTLEVLDFGIGGGANADDSLVFPDATDPYFIGSIGATYYVLETKTLTATAITAFATDPGGCRFDDNGDFVLDRSGSANFEFYDVSADTITAIVAKQQNINTTVGLQNTVLAAVTNDYIVARYLDYYFIVFDRATGTEQFRFSSQADADIGSLITLPTLNAAVTDYEIRVLEFDRTNNIVDLFLTAMTGAPDREDWDRYLRLDLSTGIYTDTPSLPFIEFYDTLIDEVLYEYEEIEDRDYAGDVPIIFFNTIYRQAILGGGYRYNNLEEIFVNAGNDRYSLNNGFAIVTNNSTYKVYRVQTWGQDYDDVHLHAEASLNGLFWENATPDIPALSIFLGDRPAGHNMIEVLIKGNNTSNLAWNIAEDVRFEFSNDPDDLTLRYVSSFNGIGGGADRLNNNNTNSFGVYASFNNNFEMAFTLPGGFDLSLGNVIRVRLYFEDSQGAGFVQNDATCYMVIEDFMGVLNAGGAGYKFAICELSLEEELYPSWLDIYGPIERVANAGETLTGQIVVRTWRTESRRQEGVNYEPFMA